MNEMLLVEKARVINAKKRVVNKEPKNLMQKMENEGYKQCLIDLDLWDYDPVEAQKKIDEIRNKFYGEEDDDLR